MVLEAADLNPTELSAYCRERGLYPEQVERWHQASQDANDKPVLTLKKQKELERPHPRPEGDQAAQAGAQKQGEGSGGGGADDCLKKDSGLLAGLPKSMNQDVASTSVVPPQRQYSLDVVGQLAKALADRSVAATPQQVHHDGSQEGEHRRSGPVGVAMGVLTQLGVAAPCLSDDNQVEGPINLIDTGQGTKI